MAFKIIDAKRERSPLILAVSGPSGSGKTYTACELAVGCQKVTGGRIGLIDTEARRGLHYADLFRDSNNLPMRYLDFEPPFGPLRYLEAFEQMISEGCKVIVADSMTHEHNGEGGVMEQIEALLDKWCGDDWKKRDASNQRAHGKVKPMRRKLNNRLVQLGRGGTVIILCYRANSGAKPDKDADGKSIVRQTGLKQETTSNLIYEVTQGFLLRHGSQGVPDLHPQTFEEGVVVKNPVMFRGWFKDGEQLKREHGEKMARWAEGGDGANVQPKKAAAPPTSTTPEMPTAEFDDVIDQMKLAPDLDSAKFIANKHRAGFSKAQGAVVRSTLENWNVNP